MDYRKTLNLPQTDFSMKANLAQKEPAILEKWYQENLYHQIREKSKGKKKFILHDGPPYANGHIHIGHALNKILKDMIVKFRTMQGFDSEYIPGWDCHGLPIEHQLFKELKTDKSKVDRVEFRRQAHDYAMKFVGIQKEEFKRLGVFGDWDNPYLTLTPEYEYWILKSLASLAKNNYVYRGLKPVNWCATCETALAEAEVEYEDHTAPAIYVKFKVSNPEVIKDLPKGKDVFLLVWTTTPWTLLANVAVAVHPTYSYTILSFENEVLIVEKTLFEQQISKMCPPPKNEFSLKGNELMELRYTSVLNQRKNCPVVTADYVTTEDGTGLVHIAPGHGQEDFEVGLKYKLDVVMPVDPRGIYTKEAGEYAGTHVFKANEKIIEDLKNKGLLFHRNDIPHSYPHCWRCKKPIIFRATEQWFLKIDHNNLREKINTAIKSNVQWIPVSGQERILGMVKTRPDWCLSRQRYWGVPIPAVVCKGCNGEHKLFPEIIESFAEITKKAGSDAWFEMDINEIIPKGFVCPVCKKNDFEKTDDILDVWFDSGVSHQAVVKAMMKEKLPIALYLEGSDQHRGWFQSSLIPAMAIEGKPPYQAVLTHGFVMDGQGRKMSKSLGNVVSPQDIMKSYGADILRLWVASSNYNDDIRISKEIIERLVDAYRKIRNTARFILSNLYDYNHDKDHVEYTQLLDIDKWAMFRLGYMLNAVTKSFDHYDFEKAYKAIYAFCNDDLSSIYLDILKDRLYTAAAKSLERRSAQTVLYDIVNILVRIISPILTFTAQEIFEALPKPSDAIVDKNVHLLDWPTLGDIVESFSKVDERLKLSLELRPTVLKLLEEKRQTGTIGSSLDAQIIVWTSNEKVYNDLKANELILPSVFIVSQVRIEKNNEQKSPDTLIVVNSADGEKCSRCWNYSLKVGQDKDHPTLCERCAPTVKEMGNVR